MLGKLFLLSTVLFVLGFLATAAMAAPGAIMVDDDNLCSDKDREHNQFVEGDAVWVWLNLHKENSFSADYSIRCNDGTTVSCDDIEFDKCQPPFENWYESDDAVILPQTNGKTACVMHLWVDGTNCTENISGDAWLQTDD